MLIHVQPCYYCNPCNPGATMRMVHPCARCCQTTNVLPGSKCSRVYGATKLSAAISLVESCFEGAENGVRFSMSPLAYRRRLREDVCAHAEGRLIGELTAAGHEIPYGNEIRKRPEPEVIGDEVEDREWRAEMAERMHRLEVRNEGHAVAIAKLERQLRELMLSRTPQHGIDGEAAGEGHGDVARAGGTGEPARVEVMGGDNAGTHDSNPGAHGERPVAAVETGEGGKVRDEGVGGLLGTTDGNRGAREAVGTGHSVTASNVDVDLVSAYSTGTETTSRNTARGRDPSSGYTGISRREGKWAARLCLDNNWLALGRYTEVLDAAKAFAVAAHICQPSISSSKMVQLSVEERRCLEGLTSQGVERIVDAKRWAEWRNWREVLSTLPEPSTPAPAGVHTQAPPLLSHQHPGATFGNYHPPAAAFAGPAGATLNPGGWQPYTHRHPPPNLHFPSQRFAFNQIPIHPFSQVQAPISVHPAPSAPIAPNPAGHSAAQNTAPHPHVLPTPPAVAPSTAHPVAGMTDSQHSLSMSTSPNNPNPPSHGSALASKPAAGSNARVTRGIVTMVAAGGDTGGSSNVAAGAVGVNEGVGEILAFWFGEFMRPGYDGPAPAPSDEVAKARVWFSKNDDVDAFIRTRFAPLIPLAASGQLAGWEDTPHGALALLVLLDQFTRNSFRGSPDAFAQDHVALEIAKRAIDKGFDRQVPRVGQPFFYLPFEHAEDLAAQDRCIELMTQMVEDAPEGPVKGFFNGGLNFAHMHRDIIVKFADSPSQLQKFMMRFETAAAAQSFSAAIQGLMNDEKEANLHSCVTQPSQPQSAVEEALPLSIQLQACILDPTFQEFVHQVETVWNQLQENLAPELANQALLEQAPQQP
ncbi:unnamed protein product [Closterium sp. NIES-54]